MRNILGWIKKWESLKTNATFDLAAKLAKLDAAKTDNQSKLAKYNHWVEHGTHFTERLENWKKDDGKYFNEKVIKNYLQNIKDSLESVEQKLDSVKQNELDQINHYIENGEVSIEERILPIELKGALEVKTNVFSDLTKKWINYSQNINFKTNANEIKELAGRVNKLGAKIKTSELIKYCKEVLAKKPELIEDDTYDLLNLRDKDHDWLDWFFTWDPEIVVETIALQEIKADSNLKKQILKKMEDYKEDQKGLVRLDLSVYEDDKEFTEKGIIKYYAEKLGGQNYIKKYYEKPFEDNQQEGFWRINNSSAWAAKGGILLLLSSLGWVI